MCVCVGGGGGGGRLEINPRLLLRCLPLALNFYLSVRALKKIIKIRIVCNQNIPVTLMLFSGAKVTKNLIFNSRPEQTSYPFS